MRAKLRSVFDDDDRGVSPVIGVILMVAITVILAAVIGTFVLNLGGDLQQTPQAQISVESADSADTIKISHNGGDTLQLGDISIQDSNGNSLTDDETTDLSTSGEFSVGDSETINDGDVPTDGNEITVVFIHNPSDSILVEKTITV